MLTLKLRLQDWLILCGIGLFFSITLSLLSYFIADTDLFDGFLFGSILGFCLCSFAIVAVIVLNYYLLPSSPKKYWIAYSITFSFLCGFLATLSTFALAQSVHVKILSKLLMHRISFCVFIGIMSCIVAYLLYRFISIGRQREADEKLLVQSRLKSLERQLNPHFLFNALNSLVELLHTNPQRAEKSLLLLSSFLRSSMHEKSMIALGEEIDNVARYVALENIRFADKIFLSITIKNELKNFLIPKFSIQLIVENAIKHGYKNETLTINIKAVITTNGMEILISNDGNAIDDLAFGVGLRNLEERLALLCNGKLLIIETAQPTFMLIIKDIQ